MMGFLSWLIPVLFFAVFLSCLPYWKWSGCKCGRTRLPWFGYRHEKHWVLIGLVVLWCVGEITLVLSRSGIFIQIMYVFLIAYQLKVVVEHGKGKRRWPKRVYGWVRINTWGRLVVES